MKPIIPRSSISRRILLSTLAALPALTGLHLAAAQAQLPQRPEQAQVPGNALPSWNDGPAKQAILDFVRTTTDASSPNFVPPEQRIATFDQDGTLWVEHPMYTQVVYCLERVPGLIAKDPKLKNVQPFKTVLSGDREAMAKLALPDLVKILAATLTGMSVEQFDAEAKMWIETAKHPRWKRLYTDLTYQPMQEVMSYL